MFGESNRILQGHFYRPASEVLFSFRQYIQQTKEQPFFAIIHLKDCQTFSKLN